MKKILIILLSVSISILFPCTFQLASAEDSSSNSTNEKTETYTAMYTGQGQYKNDWIDKRTYKFTFTGCKTDHDVAIHRTSSLDADKEAYYSFWIYNNDGVVVACNASGTMEDIRNGETEYDREWSQASCPETQMGSIYSNYKDVSTTMAASSSIPMFDDYADVKQYLADGTRGDSEVAYENTPEKYSDDVPAPQEVKFSDMTLKDGLIQSTFGGCFTWSNLDNVPDGLYIEIEMKNSYKYVGVYGGDRGTYTSEYTVITPTSLLSSSVLLYYLPTTYKGGKYTPMSIEGDDSIAAVVATKNGLTAYDDVKYTFGSDLNKSTYKTFEATKYDYRARNYILKDGVKYVSSWVNKTVSDPVSLTKNDDTDNKAVLTDPDGNETNQSYTDAASSSSDYSNDTSFNFLKWIAKQIDGVSTVLTSTKNAFGEAVDTGSSFVSMFKSYNSWLPEAFVSMLVAGIGIAVFLRIIGR